MGAKELREVVLRGRARNEEHAKNEGLRESESLKLAHDRRAKLRLGLTQLSALRRRIETTAQRLETEAGRYDSPIPDDRAQVSAQLKELAELVDLLVRDALASGAAR